MTNVNYNLFSNSTMVNNSLIFASSNTKGATAGTVAKVISTYQNSKNCNGETAGSVAYSGASGSSSSCGSSFSAVA